MLKYEGNRKLEARIGDLNLQFERSNGLNKLFVF